MTAKPFKRFKINVHHKAVRPLTDVEFARLKADIAARGIQTPVVVAGDGTVVDGHHRIRAAKDLKIPMANIPWSLLSGDADPADTAVSLNVARRQLTAEELQAYVDKGLQDGKSVRQIAEETGASKSKVGRAAGKSKAPKTTTVKGKDGRVQVRTSKGKTKANAAKRRKPSKLETAKAAFKALSDQDRTAFMAWAFGEVSKAA